MPRKKKSENLRHKNVITLKLTDAELELLDHSSKILGLSRSEFLRKSFLEKDIQFRYEVVADMDELRKLVSKYGKIGSNLNQIARYFNTGGEWSEEMKDEIRQCISELFSLRKEVLRKYAVERQDYMDKPHEQEAELRLVTYLQTNVKAMQNQAYARKVKISNLQQMANTLIYIQDHGYDTREDLEKQTSDIQMKMEEAQDQLSDLISKMKTLNTQIHYTGQYFTFKSVYAEFLKSRNKKKFRQEHSSDIRSYEEARD